MPAPYERLLTYWYCLLICDHTVLFCEAWIRSFKLKEQMNGAARSGKQNVVEGSESLRTSLKTCIKLTNVAKASLEELLEDFEDFARQRGLKVWGKDDPRTLITRRKIAALVSNLSYSSDSREEKEKMIKERLPLSDDPEEAVNLLITLGHQASYMLRKQVDALEEKHRKEGGYTEKLYRERVAYRSKQ